MITKYKSIEVKEFKRVGLVEYSIRAFYYNNNKIIEIFDFKDKKYYQVRKNIQSSPTI